MPSVAYLTGSESASARVGASSMDRLFRELNRRMSVLFGSRSFALGFNPDTGDLLTGQCIPGNLVGKCFFFTGTRRTRYAQRFPQFRNIDAQPPTVGPSQPGAFTCKSYNHAPFLAAVTELTPTSFDDANRIANYPAVPDSYYAGITQARQPFTSFWDHSLQAHTIQRNGLTYYVRETGIEGLVANAEQPPEKSYRYALAEIIIENQDLTLELPASYDKYSCFRIHNLQPKEQTVSFAGVFAVVLQPFGCATVRRTSATADFAGYETGYNYFLKYREGDYRHFWFFPTSFHQDVLVIENRPVRAYENVSSSMQANNLSNPCILYDWINALTIIPGEAFDEWAPASRPAWFVQDEYELHNIYNSYSPAYSTLFGNPANASTKVADLIHHKGTILIIKQHKTENFITDEGVDSGWKRIEFDTVEFRGWETINADLGAKNLKVGRLANGTPTIYKDPLADTDWNYDISPIGTNLFKNGDKTHPALFRLGTTANTGAPIERNFFESWAQGPSGLIPNPPAITDRAPYLTPRRTLVERPNVFTWQDNITFQTRSVTGDGVAVVADVARGGQRNLSATGLDQITVNDLINLSFFGDVTQSNQSNVATTYIVDGLTLTETGLVLRFRERFPSWAETSFTPPSADWLRQLSGDPASGYFEVKRVIKFRGHGWPIPELGSGHVGFLGPRYGRCLYSNDYQYEIKGPAGVDYSIPDLGITESVVKSMARVTVGDLENGLYSGRFWRKPRVDNLLTIQSIRDRGDLVAAGWMTNTAPTARLNGVLPDRHPIAFRLLPEHYNAMARVVNSLKTGKPLGVNSLRFYYTNTTGRVVLGSLAANPYFFHNASNRYLPTPLDCFAALTTVNSQRIATAAGLVIRTENDLPDYSTYQNYRGKRQGVMLTPDVDIRLSYSTTLPDGTVLTDGEVTHTEAIGTIKFTVGSSVEDNMPTSDGVGQVFSPAGRFALANYTGFRWIKTTDVKSLAEKYGFQFRWQESFAPLQLKEVRLPSDPSGSSITLEWIAGDELGARTPYYDTTYPFYDCATGQRVPPQFDLVPPANPNAGPFYRRVEALVMTPVRDDETPLSKIWKLPGGTSLADISDVDGGSPFFISEHSAFGAVVGYAGISQCTGTFGGASRGVIFGWGYEGNVGPGQRSAPVFLRFSPKDSRESEGAQAWRDTYGLIETLNQANSFTAYDGAKTLGVYVLTTAGNETIAREVILRPWHGITGQWDWFEDDALTNIVSVQPDDGGFIRRHGSVPLEYVAPKREFRRFALAHGFNLITADEPSPRDSHGTAWRVVADPRGPVISLE